MSEAEQMYRYNIEDEALQRIFNERDEVIEARIRAEANAAADNRLYIIRSTQSLFDALEKKTRRLQAQGNIVFSLIEGGCIGVSISAACSHDWLSMAAILLIGAVFALFWAVIEK